MNKIKSTENSFPFPPSPASYIKMKLINKTVGLTNNKIKLNFSKICLKFDGNAYINNALQKRI